MSKVSQKLECKIVALDNWHPTRDDGTIDLTFDRTSKTLSLWGDDDFGMIKENSSVEEFRKLSRRTKPISIKIAKDLGFQIV